MMAQILVVLPSIHDILAVEDRVRAAGLWVDVLPKPTAIATDCGMVLGCRSRDLPAYLRHIRDVGLSPVAVYRVLADGYARVESLVVEPEPSASP